MRDPQSPTISNPNELLSHIDNTDNGPDNIEPQPAADNAEDTSNEAASSHKIEKITGVYEQDRIENPSWPTEDFLSPTRPIWNENEGPKVFQQSPTRRDDFKYAAPQKARLAYLEDEDERTGEFVKGSMRNARVPNGERRIEKNNETSTKARKKSKKHALVHNDHKIAVPNNPPSSPRPNATDCSTPPPGSRRSTSKATGSLVGYKTRAMGQ
jgi:hypothetical protein